MGKFVSEEAAHAASVAGMGAWPAAEESISRPAHCVQSGKWSRGKFYKCLILSIMYFGHCCYHPGIHNCCRNVFKSIMIIVAAPWPPAHLGWEIEKNNFWPQKRIWPDCWDYKRTETCCHTDIGPRDRVMPGIVSQMSACVTSRHLVTWWGDHSPLPSVTLKVSLITICWHHSITPHLH